MTGSSWRVNPPQASRWLAILILCGFAGLPVHAQDKPSLKEILGRAQSDSERKAVEDLIGKLQGKPAKPNTPVMSSDTPEPKSETIDQAAHKDAAAASSEPASERGTLLTPSSEDNTSRGATTPLERKRDLGSSEKMEQPAVADRSAATGEGVKDSPAPESPKQSTALDQQPSSEPPKFAAKPEAEPADLAVEKADRDQLPSVDLEVLFEFDSAKLTPEAVETLTTLGRALVDDRLAASTFLIGGHTDGKGRASYNLRLSERRAQAVRQFLIATFDIDAERLTAKGFGSRYLKNTQRPRAAENRRVQVINLSQQEAR